MWKFGRLLVVIMMVISYSTYLTFGQSNDDEVDKGEGDLNCHLTSQSFYSYIVRIWNKAAKNTSAHGSILSYKAIVTICSPFIYTKNRVVYPRRIELFEVYAQKHRNIVDPDWDLEGKNVCSQVRPVLSIRPHPRCSPHQDLDLYYNFAIILISRPFLVFNQHSYPALNFPNTISVLVYLVTLVNVIRSPGCEIPLLYYHARTLPVFSHKMEIRTIRYLVECIPKWCDTKSATGAYVEKICRQTMRTRLNYTMLCVYFPHDPLIKLGHDYMSRRSLLWTGGAPLVCNGTAIGHTAAAKDRTHYLVFQQDFYVINTYVRVWSWLVRDRQEYGQDWLENNLLEKSMDLRGATPRVGGTKPPIPAEYLRGLSDDEKGDTRNRSTTYGQLLMPFGYILLFTIILVFKNLC